MKQKDIAIIIAVVIFSAVLATIATKLFLKPGDRKQKVEVVAPISADFPTPDPRFFNNRALDPTQQIQIGDSSNTDPFKGQQQ
jgi:hypothetical protein